MITIAKLDDADKIMKFIDNEWKKGHILAKNKSFFLYEFANRDELNFVISKIEGQINGILGFLKSASDDNATVWTTIWKVSKSNGSPMLGIHLLNYLCAQGYKSVMSNGINHATEEIYNYLGFNVGELNHYYIPNQRLDTYKIAKFPNAKFNNDFNIQKNGSLALKKIKVEDLLNNFLFTNKSFRNPYKDFNYFKKRFFDHPIYNYEVYGVFREAELLSILVARVVEEKKSSCIRVVDFYGQEESLSTFIWYLYQKMHSEGHEYIDFLCFGLDEIFLKNLGFTKLKKIQNEIVIPNYFEPFIQSNVNIKFFSNTENLNDLRIYKADGDQDRPSVTGENNG